jgi:hypothetical protein
MRMLFYLVGDLQNEEDLCSVPQVANATLGAQGAGACTARKMGYILLSSEYRSVPATMDGTREARA